MKTGVVFTLPLDVKRDLTTSVAECHGVVIEATPRSDTSATRGLDHSAQERERSLDGD